MNNLHCLTPTEYDLWLKLKSEKEQNQIRERKHHKSLLAQRRLFALYDGDCVLRLKAWAELSESTLDSIIRET